MVFVITHMPLTKAERQKNAVVRKIPRTESNIREYEKYHDVIIDALLKANYLQLSIPKDDPNYGIGMSQLEEATHLNRNTLMKHLEAGLMKNGDIIFPPLVGYIVRKKKNGRQYRYYLEPAAKIFPIWEYLVNELTSKGIAKNIITYEDFFYGNATVFIPGIGKDGKPKFNIASVPLETWVECLKLMSFESVE